MALSDVDRLYENEVEQVFALGPIPASGSNRRRLRLIIKTDGNGVAGVDIGNVQFAGGLATTDTATVANLETGTDLIGVCVGDDGTPANVVYGGTTKFAPFPYVVVGSQLEYRIPIPEFTGADRYLILVFFPSSGQGVIAMTSAYVEQAGADYGEDVPLSTFYELSWVLPATTVAFVNVGPFNYNRHGARLRVDFGGDVTASTVSIRAVRTTGSTRDQTAFDAGVEIGGGTVTSPTFPFGALRTRYVAIPSIIGSAANHYALLRVEVGDGAQQHSQLMLTVEGPSREGNRSRARVRSR